MRTYILLFTILALSGANENGKDSARNFHIVRKESRSYVCPPNFLRLSYKCYYFSNTTADWLQAYWKCKDMHSNLVTIRNPNQDKILRRTLDKNSLLPMERWIGGRYDWGTMSWKWGASGKKIEFEGFLEPMKNQSKDDLIWNCIIMDPQKHYKWSYRKCTQQKHYICQTKIRNVSNKGKKKLQKQYKTDKYNKLNEVPVPDLPTNEISNDITGYLNDNGAPYEYAYRVKDVVYKPRKEKKDIKDAKEFKDINSNKRDGIESSSSPHRKRIKGQGRKHRERKLREKLNKNKDDVSMHKMNWKVYYEKKDSPHHPRVAVEEFSFNEQN